MENNSHSVEQPTLAIHRSVYVRAVERKLAEKRRILEIVKHKIHEAEKFGRIARSDQLVNAERRADSCLLAVESWVTRLNADPDTDWEDSRVKTDNAMDELTTSVKQMVARFT